MSTCWRPPLVDCPVVVFSRFRGARDIAIWWRVFVKFLWLPVLSSADSVDMCSHILLFAGSNCIGFLPVVVPRCHHSSREYEVHKCPATTVRACHICFCYLVLLLNISLLYNFDGRAFVFLWHRHMFCEIERATCNNFAVVEPSSGSLVFTNFFVLRVLRIPTSPIPGVQISVKILWYQDVSSYPGTYWNFV